MFFSSRYSLFGAGEDAVEHGDHLGRRQVIVHVGRRRIEQRGYSVTT